MTPASRPVASATATATARSSSDGRNSCSGGSISRIVTGSPDIASKISTKSSRCSGSSASRAACRSSGSCARISRSTSSRRSPRNMCSVRHRPMPSAPNRRARAESGPLSAFVRTLSRRAMSACRMIRSTDATSGDESAGDGALEVLHDQRRLHRHLAEVDAAGRTVDRDHVAFGDGTAVDGELQAGQVDAEGIRATDARSCPCPGRRRRRATSCRHGSSGCPGPRSCRGGRPGWSRGVPG